MTPAARAERTEAVKRACGPGLGHERCRSSRLTTPRDGSPRLGCNRPRSLGPPQQRNAQRRFNGRPIAERSLALIAAELQLTPIVGVIDPLIMTNVSVVARRAHTKGHPTGPRSGPTTGVRSDQQPAPRSQRSSAGAREWLGWGGG